MILKINKLLELQEVIEENETETAIIQRRGLRFTKDLPEGHILEKDDLFPLRPLNHDGISPYEIVNIVGKRLNRQVKTDDYIRKEDIE